jgi:predicted outer membrane protein
MVVRRRVAAVALATSALVSSCTGTDLEDVQVTDPATPQGVDRGEDPTGTDRPISSIVSFSPREVASVMLVMNRDEIAQGEIAAGRATSDEVRVFARRMVEDHASAAQRMESIVTQVEVERDPTARVLSRHAALLRQDLEQVPAAEVDITYMTAQVAAHSKALTLLDRGLMPSVAQNTGRESIGGGPPIGGLGPTALRGLDTELRQRRTAIAAHLDEALRIQERLRIPMVGGGGGGATAPR